VVLCLCAATPALAFTGNLSAITYLDDSLENRIEVFAISDEGHLVAKRFDGTRWTWIDHGLPPGSTSLRTVDAVTNVDASGKRRFYVFVIDNERRLKLRYLEGALWKWADQGGSQLSMSMQSAITYVDTSGNRRLYYFTDNGGLRYNYWNGSSWQWVHVGYPTDIPGGILLGGDAITYIDEQGNRRIDVFCIFMFDNQQDLYSYSWNGGSWSWTNLGGAQNQLPRAVTFSEASGTRRVRIFVSKSDEEVRMRSWNGAGPGVGGWTNLSKPSSLPDSSIGARDAIAYTDSDGNRRMQVFVRFDDRVYSRQWDGSSWLGWFSHGFPSGSSGISAPTVVAYAALQTGVRHIHMFVKCSGSDHLCVQHYDGVAWTWQDLGAP
jgi:hypothetical protein